MGARTATAFWGKTDERAGVVGLFLFAFFALWSESGSNVGLLLIVAACVVSAGAWRTLGREPVFIACLAFWAYVVARAGWEMAVNPAVRSLELGELVLWARLPLFVCFAWLIARFPQRLAPVLVAVAFGLVLKLLMHEDWLGLYQAFFGEERLGFGFKPIKLGLYAVTALLGLLLFASALMGGRTRRARVWRAGLWFFAVVVLTIVLVAGKVRGAWLPAILVIPVVLFLHARPSITHVKTWSPARWALAAGIGAVLLAMTGLGIKHVAERTLEESDTVEAVLEGEQTSDAVNSPISLRVNAYRFGWDKWLRRPVFGWGLSHYGQNIIDPKEHPELLHHRGSGWRPLGHLHNTYLELLVRLGLAGTLILTVLVALVLRGAWRGYRAGAASRDQLLFVLGAFAITGIWAMFTFNATKIDWQNFWILMAGTAYSFHLRARLA